MDRSTDIPLFPLYGRLLCWLGPLLALLAAFQFEFNRTEQAFNRAADQAVSQIESKIKTFEVALEGFSNFLTVAVDIDDEEIRAYVRGIRQLYPDLYMFEISSRIGHHQRPEFEQSMRDRGYRNFSIHGFDYGGDQQVLSVGTRPVYYPIRFIEPETPQTIPLLGLDLGSVSTVLVDTVLKSIGSPHPVASRPFELLEGGKGYVLYRPLTSAGEQASSGNGSAPLSFAMLAIRARDLLPGWLQNQNSYTVSLAYRQQSPEQSREVLIEPVAQQPDSLLSRVVHTYSRRAEIDNPSQPFELSLSKSIRWSDLSLLRMLAITLAGVLLSWLSARQLTRLLNRRASLRQQQQQLYQRANFDLLTGLPNMSLLADRAGQAISAADRSGSGVAVCYLDIDRFKQINDRWGHDAGDTLLIGIASRLTKILRQGDTAARIHGDEFIVLLPDVSDPESLQHLTEKITSVFLQPFEVGGQLISVRGSLGAALYPQDAEQLEALLDISDQRMYRGKPAKRGSDAEDNDRAESA